MKKTKRNIKKGIVSLFAALVISVGGLFQSCNFLDIDPYVADLFTLDTIFSKKVYTEKYLNNVYSYLVDYASPSVYTTNSMPWSLISDEGVAGYKRGWHNYNYFCNNEIDPSNSGAAGLAGLGSFDRFNYFYEGIRKANTFLKRVYECKDVTDFQRSEWIGEATFIKANIYFELMLAHGPIPIVPEEPVDFDTPIDQMFVERNTWDFCNNYVSDLLETAIKLLPSHIKDNSEMGKPIKASALAVLSRLTLYSASPLYNGSNAEFANYKNKAGEPYLNPIMSNEKWGIAAANAKRLVDDKPNHLYTVPKMSNTPHLPVPAHEQADFPDGVGGIDPYHSYSDMFTGECALASSNSEILFSRQGSSAGHVRYSMPGVIGGWQVFLLPQSVVDAFYMADGRDQGSSSPEYPYERGYTTLENTFSGAKDGNGMTILTNTYNWYVNREMRFYASVAFNNSYFASTSTPVDKVDAKDGRVAKYFSDSKSGRDEARNRPAGEKDEYPMTGYLCRKYVHYEDSYNSGRIKNKYSISYRMAEVYLNYVEAMNELDKSYTYNEITVSRDQNEMKRCFNLIRYRAGLPGITDNDVANVSKMRELIARERLIEFLWEGRRYHDLRRTKTAVIHENVLVTGCNVSASSKEPDNFYNVVRVRETPWMYKVFSTRQTFLPIPKSEIDKNKNLDQTPGY